MDIIQEVMKEFGITTPSLIVIKDNVKLTDVIRFVAKKLKSQSTQERDEQALREYMDRD